MPLEHDKRARKPHATEPLPEGDRLSGDSFDEADGGLDLRAGQHKLGLGRIPRDESESVKETITRYKEAQARKFAEYGSENRAEASVHHPILNDSAPLQPSSDFAVTNIERVSTTGKLRFAEDELATPDDLDSGETNPETVLFNEESPLAEGAADRLPENKPLSNDCPLSHERTSSVLQEREGRLQHEPTTVDAAAELRKNHDLMYAEALFTGGEQTQKDFPEADTAAITFEEHGGDWLRSYAPAYAKVDDEADGGIPDIAENSLPDINTGYAPIYYEDGSEFASAGEADAITAEPEAVPIVPNDSAAPRVPGIETKADSGIAPDDKKPKPRTPGKMPQSDNHETAASGKKKTGKLKFEDEADAPADKNGKKLNKTLEKAERTSEKLSVARKKLPTKRVLRTGKEFDAEKGKLKPRLRFETEVKTRREHLRGPAITRPIKSGANAAFGYAHKKVFQVEDENVAVKAAHRAEMVAEGGIRAAYRFAKNTPFRRVRNLERTTAELSIKSEYQKALRDNPALEKKPIARMIQKQKIKRQYAQAARDAHRAGKETAVVLQKTGALVSRAAVKVKAVLANPKVLIICGLLLLIVLLLFGLISSCSNMVAGIGSSVTTMSYLAKDEDVDSAELRYTELETDMRIRVLNTETDYPGYDEYRYDIGSVGHDPYMLIAFLSAVYKDFNYAVIQPVLDSLFAEQYQLTYSQIVEIRYRTETHTSSWTDADGNTYSESYTVEVPYEWYVLSVRLVSRPFYNVISPRMDASQMEHYALLMESKGLRKYVASPFAFDWQPYISSYYGYRVSPINGVKDYHMGIDIGLPTGTEILAAQNGTVTFSGDLGGYGYVVVIEDGDGLVTKYAHCDTLLVSAGQTVAVGDVIATVGNTGSSTGPHLHFEIIKNGRYLNPAYFALTSYY